MAYKDFNGDGYTLINNVSEHIASDEYQRDAEPSEPFFSLELKPGFAFADIYEDGAYGNTTGQFIFADGWDENAALQRLDAAKIDYDTVQSVYRSRCACDKMFAIVVREGDVDAAKAALAS